VLLGLTLVTAFLMMKDLGFTPHRGKGPLKEVRKVVRASIDNGWRKRPIRWLMLAAPFTGGVGIYAFYAMQPYLLELYGDEEAYFVAGLAAAIIAGAQIVGGFMVPLVRRLFVKRTDVLIFTAAVSAVVLMLIGLVDNFYAAIALLVIWALAFAASMPMRQAYLNGLIESEHRATVLSFDALMSSAGGVVTQPVLGRVADVNGYGTSYVVSAAIQVAAVPFIYLARREAAESDAIEASV
jgi:MFS family permease